MASIIAGFLVILLAGMIQGLTSFGFSLISVPLLSIFMPLKIVVPVLIVFSLVLNSVILYKLRKHVNLKRIMYLIPAGILTTPLGTYLLLIINERSLKLGVGLIVTITAIMFWLGYKIKIKNEKLSLVSVGLMSGLLNGSVSLSGPPVILFLTNQGTEKQVFRANLTSYFFILNIITIPTYIYGGLITSEVLRYTLILFPALILGVILGIKGAERVDENLFKKLTLVLVVIMGILSIISGIR